MANKKNLSGTLLNDATKERDKKLEIDVIRICLIGKKREVKSVKLAYGIEKDEKDLLNELKEGNKIKLTGYRENLGVYTDFKITENNVPNNNIVYNNTPKKK